MAFKVRSSAKIGEALPLPEQELKYTLLLNRVLPAGVRVLGWAPVDDEFSARFDCQYRAYKYFFMGGSMDISKMQEASRGIIGEHDYRNFCTMDVANATHFNRAVLDLRINPVSHTTSTDPRYQLYEAYIKGTAFLYHQVRCTMSLLFMIGRGQEDPSVIQTLLDIKKTPRKPQYPIASDVPLVLYDTGFDPERVAWHLDVDAHARAKAHFTQLLVNQFSLQTAVVHCVMEKLQEGSQEADNGPESEEKAAKHIKLADRQTEETYEERKEAFDRRQAAKESRKATEPS